MTNFNTVVLFDVENLLGEPSRWKQAATELSFNDIIAQLRRDDSGLIGDFAVSRAYANWGLQFMGALRREMTENGVEPRQIFAYDAAAKTQRGGHRARHRRPRSRVLAPGQSRRSCS